MYFRGQYDKMSVQSSDSIHESEDEPYVSTMHLSFVTYLNVGYYYCVKKSAMSTEFIEKIDSQWEVVSEIITNIVFAVIKNGSRYFFRVRQDTRYC